MATRRRCKSSERKPLPGCVTARRVHKEDKREPEETPLQLDKSAVLAMKPERRMKWLTAALQRLQKGKVDTSGIYDILVHARFSEDAGAKVGLKMYAAICANINFFSQKQRRCLESESKLALRFKDRVPVAAEANCESRLAATESTAGDGDPKEMATLMGKLLTLTAPEAQKFMATLDGDKQDRLEELLESRIAARVAGVPREGSEAVTGGGPDVASQALGSGENGVDGGSSNNSSSSSVPRSSSSSNNASSSNSSSSSSSSSSRIRKRKERKRKRSPSNAKRRKRGRGRQKSDSDKGNLGSRKRRCKRR